MTGAKTSSALALIRALQKANKEPNYAPYHNALAALLAFDASEPEEERWDVTPPYLEHVQQLVATRPCLYVLEKTCRERTDDPDHWCGYCAGSHEAKPLTGRATRAEGKA